MRGSARGLAKLAAYMANKGQLDGKTILSEDSYNELTSDFTSKPEFGLDASLTFSKGGVCKLGPATDEENQMMQGDLTRTLQKRFVNGRTGYIGWVGFGGSVFQW